MPGHSGRRNERAAHTLRHLQVPPFGLAALAVAAAALTGCAVPFENSRERMLQLQDARAAARGAWIVVRDRDGVADASGELLAASADSVFVAGEHGFAAIASEIVARSAVTVYEAPSEPSDPPVLRLTGNDRKRWKTLVRYARFPQGLPAGFDRSAAASPSP